MMVSVHDPDIPRAHAEMARYELYDPFIRTILLRRLFHFHFKDCAAFLCK